MIIDNKENHIICQTGIPIDVNFLAPLYCATNTSDIKVNIPNPPKNAHAIVPELTAAFKVSNEYLAKKHLSTNIISNEAKEDIINGRDTVQSSFMLPSGNFVSDLISLIYYLYV